MSEFKKDDSPQIVVTGRLKESRQASGADIITFKLRLAFFELFIIVTVPGEGTYEAPVYCKFRLCQQEFKEPVKCEA
jgi:hypothetical protein